MAGRGVARARVGGRVQEFLMLMGCQDVPLGRRVYFALATYTGLRRGSLLPFTWSSIDFTNGTITSLERKTGLPRIFAQADPTLPGLETLMDVLRAWYDCCGQPAPATPLIRDLAIMHPGRESEALKADLVTAGVKRQALFTQSGQVEPLRFHDLRATFVTWARRAGKGRGWISDRTGHLTDEMMRRYDRGTRMLADLKYMPFPDLLKAMPDWSNNRSNIVRLSAVRHDGEA